MRRVEAEWTDKGARNAATRGAASASPLASDDVAATLDGPARNGAGRI